MKTLVLNRRLMAAQVLFATCIAVTVGVLGVPDPSKTDFAMLWAAQHVAHPYDPSLISQATRSNSEGFFPYAPPFLLLIVPLAWVTLSAGYLLWLGLAASAIVVSLRRLSAPLVLMVPVVFPAAIVGQTSLFMAACLFGAATLTKRPWLAGVLLAVAACIKPQVGVFIPLVLLASRQWAVIAWAAGVAAALCALSTLIYGPGIWGDWLHSLPEWLRVNDKVWSGRYLSLPGGWKVAAAVIGAVAAWYAGRRGQIELGLLIAIAAALLSSLHAMDYDAAILAPFALAAALRRGWKGAPYLVAIFLPASPWSVLALGVFAIVDVAVGREAETSDRSSARGIRSWRLLQGRGPATEEPR